MGQPESLAWGEELVTEGDNSLPPPPRHDIWVNSDISSVVSGKYMAFVFMVNMLRNVHACTLYDAAASW